MSRSPDLSLSKRFIKMISKRGWKVFLVKGNIVVAHRVDYVVVFLLKEGRSKIFVDRNDVIKALDIRNYYRKRKCIADAVLAARIGRKWHFLLLTKPKSIRLERGFASNWYP